MTTRRQAVLAALIPLLPATASRAQGTHFPPSTVTNVVPVGPGSATDTLARLFAPRMAEAWKTNVIVDNRPGANGIPATSSVVNAAGDGSALLWGASNHVINESLYNNLPYKGLKDLRPIANIGYAPLILCVPANFPVSNLRELIALAASKPGKLNFGSAGSGSTTHLAGEMLKRAAKIDIVHIPYKQIQQAVTDLLAGTLDMLFLAPPTAMGQLRSGRLKAIGVSTKARLQIAPEIQTLAESGLPEFEVQAFLGIFAPAAMTDVTAQEISTAIVRITKSSEVDAAITKFGLIPGPLAFKEFANLVEQENTKWSRVIKEAGIKPD